MENVKYPHINLTSKIKRNDQLKGYEMQEVENRLESFVEWSFPRDRVNEFVLNGFFHTGFTDRVKCMFCDIGMLNWLIEDNINEEHKKFSPNCPFFFTNEKYNKKNQCKRVGFLELI